MTDFFQLLASLTATFLVYGVYRLSIFWYRELVTSPLLNLPGPKSPSFIWGNLKQIWAAENSVLQEKWVHEYGPTLSYKGFVGINRLYTLDHKAINHVLMNDYTYQKLESTRYNLGLLVGEGLLMVEGDKHKQQKKIMNPAFGAAQIRELTEIMVAKSLELRDIWAAIVDKDQNNCRVDVLSWLSKMTLDVIGLAGFNYKFNALSSNPEDNELNEAFATMFRAGTTFSVIPFLRGFFPALRWLPMKRDAQVTVARKTMARIGKQLLSDSKAIMEEDATQNSSRGRDLLSLLLRANLGKDIPDNKRMSDSDVLAQVPTFLVAGHETTSNATTWALYALTQAPEVQVKLRQELLTVSTDNPSMDDLNSLPYLDAVVRETLRVHAPVSMIIRVAMQDDVLPLSTAYTGNDGRKYDSIRVEKGQTIIVPILTINRVKSVWGEDSYEFKPERWTSVPEAANSIPGVWGNMLSFIGGPRACIGYRFSIIEIKALLFTLVRAFEFELAVPASEIAKKLYLVQRPIVLSEPGVNQMPLLIRSYKEQ